MRHLYRHEVRWADVDAFQHVNNATYLVYFQEARVDFHWYAPARRGETPMLMDMVVARAEVDFIEPIKEPHKFLDIEVWCSRVGNSSFDLSYEATLDGVVVSRGKTVQVAVDMKDERSRPLRDEEREFLNKYFESGDK